MSTRGVLLRAESWNDGKRPCDVIGCAWDRLPLHGLKYFMFWWGGKSDAWFLFRMTAWMVSAQRRTPSLTTCLWAPLVLIFYSAHCGRSCPGVWERAQVPDYSAFPWAVHLIQGSPSRNVFPVLGTSLNLIIRKRNSCSSHLPPSIRAPVL